MENITFAELPLGQKLQDAIVASGYTVPTPIQAQAIPIAVTGRDVLGIAQTGTGKTASFVLPMIQRLETGRARARMPRSLILAPTRELAAQVAQSFEKYGVNHKLAVALLIGGVSMDDQVRKLDRGVDVLIATPGRLLDHFSRGRIMLMGVEILVIDEADRMLDMGFIPDIEKICKLLPPKRQTLFFSATMPPEITRLVSQFLTDPVRIEVARPATAAKTITQLFRFCPDGEDFAKRELLRDLIKEHPVRNAIIFCNRKRDVAILHKSLVKHGFNAGALHGDMEQSARTATLDKFRNGEIMLLAASDVAARGLDIPDVSHVFNFDIPWAGDDYVHRIGRTGRAGKEGVSLSLVTGEDLKLIADIEKVTGETPVWIGEPPTEADFAEGGRRRRGRGHMGGRGDSRGAERGRGGEGRGGDRGRSANGGGRGEGRGESGRGPRHSRSESSAPGAGEQPRLEATRSEPQEQPAREDRPVREARAVRDERPVRDDRPAREDRPARAERPAREDRPARAERPVREDRPARAERPAREDRPARVERPAHEARADHGERAGRDNRPERHQRSDRPERRESSSRPQQQPPQERGERPARQERPQRGSGENRSRQQGSGQGSSQGGGAVGFADNVPAFLRRPVRSAKAVP